MPVSSGKSSHMYRYCFGSILNLGTKVLIRDKKWYDSMPKNSNGTVSGEYLDGTYSFSK